MTPVVKANESSKISQLIMAGGEGTLRDKTAWESS